MTQELTFNQQKLVEDNHNLIYAAMKKYNLSEEGSEDWYGVLAIGLCKAAAAYNPDRGTAFSTLAYSVMENEVKMALRADRKNVNSVASLDEPLSDEEDAAVLGDLIEDNEDCFSSVIIRDALSRARSAMKESEMDIVDKYLNEGLGQREIAQELGIAQATVSRTIIKYKNYILKNLGDEGHINF